MTVNDPTVSLRPTSKAKTRDARGPGRPTLSNEELLDKALDIFLEKGFERTTIDAITASAGMAKRTVYLRYGDKTALFKAALEQAIDAWIVPIERLRAVESDDLEETLLKVGQMLVANLMRPAGLRLLRITNAESGRMPEIGAYTYQHGTGPTLAYLVDLFRRRVRVGAEFTDAQEAAFSFLNLVVSGPPTMKAWGVALDEAAVDRHTRYSVRLFLHGLLPRETAGESLQSNDGAVGSWETQPGGTGLLQSQSVKSLETENRRLKKLLLESMLEVAALRERQDT
jgi:TetR/AcrR family transcriptional regulator, mexJK operon transcriptional repressor